MTEPRKSIMPSLRAYIAIGAIGAALTLAGSARGSDLPAMDAEVHHLDAEWARIKYQVKDKDEQLGEIEALAKEAAAVVGRYPGHVEPLLWEGIITSEEAAMASMFRQLGLASDARTMFEKAAEIHPLVADGGVNMSLGVVYYRVPGFPIGFGDDDKARRYLQSALVMNPNGLDENYFYGDFLIEQGDYAKARIVLAHALEAPPNMDRPVWDAGRRADIQALIAEVEKHLGH
jgi:tetratricopeptide (TPR) repeat protein